jgi:superkiller protein 3
LSSGIQLEGLYQQLINWSDNEDVRREADRKLLQHSYDKLVVLPEMQKREQREKVWKWAEGLVILKHPFKLAWNIFIEWKDCDSIGESYGLGLCCTGLLTNFTR